MNRTINTIAILVAFAGVSVIGLSAKTAIVGQQAPDFTLTDIAGQSYQLSDLRGKTVVLEWINPECPFVEKHYASGNLPQMQTTAARDGIVWLTINSAAPGKQGDYSPERATNWLRSKKGGPAAYLRDSDGKVGRLYGAKATPHMYVISPEGNLVYDGAIDSIRSAAQADIPRATNYVAAALEAVKKGVPATPAVTQPYGCTVKY